VSEEDVQVSEEDVQVSEEDPVLKFAVDWQSIDC